MKNRFKKIMALLFLLIIFSYICCPLQAADTENNEDTIAALNAWKARMETLISGDDGNFSNMELVCYVLGDKLWSIELDVDGSLIFNESDCTYNVDEASTAKDVGDILGKYDPGRATSPASLADTNLTNGLKTITSADTTIYNAFMYAFIQAKTSARKYVDEDLTEHKELLEFIQNSDDETNALFLQMLYEWCALEIMEKNFDMYQQMLTGPKSECYAGKVESVMVGGEVCPNDPTSAARILMQDYFLDAEGMEGISSGYLDLPCSTAYAFSKTYGQLIRIVEKMQEKNEEKQKELLSSGKVDEGLADFGANEQENTQETTDEAVGDALEQIKPPEYIFPGEGEEEEGIIGGKPELTLENLTNRVTGLIGFGKLEGLDDITNFVAGDIVNLVAEVGKYIIYAAILFMGVRIIWSGAQGKAQFKEALPFLLTAIVFFYLGENIYYLIEGILYGDELNYAESVKTLWGSIIDIIRILAFGGIMFTGLKFLFASGPDGRADVKASLLPILIGCILVFASSTIVSVVINVSKESGLDQVSKEENTSENIFLDELEYKIEV